MRVVRIAGLALCLLWIAAPARAQNDDDANRGVAVPQTERLRFNFRFLAGYGSDRSHYDIGNEGQGRVGYAIFEVSGKINQHFSYFAEINPVDETQPLPACGDRNYFYPNEPQTFGPNVQCDNEGRLRVDDYKFIALDVAPQQGPIRQAYLSYHNASGFVEGKFGRFELPIGWHWEDEGGSFTAKDATHIQRINAEANFGVMLSFNWKIATVNAAAFLGDGNRYHDYDYFYSIDNSFDTNSAMTAMVSGDLRLVKSLDVRIAQKAGYTGSRVEPLPNFYASKHRDRATVVSVKYRPVAYASVFGEYAWYTWGLMNTSAGLINLPELDSVDKNGFYLGGDVSVPIKVGDARVGTTITREVLDRDDSLIKYLWLQNLYNVTLGEKEESTVYRFYLDINRRIRVGYYLTHLTNPFPQVSGITPVAGPRAYQSFGNNKWGIVGKFSLDPR
jgi:hypothetical protein